MTGKDICFCPIIVVKTSLRRVVFFLMNSVGIEKPVFYTAKKYKDPRYSLEQ